MLELIQTLCAAAGVSGDEDAAARAAEELLSPLGEVRRTPLGSVVCQIGRMREGCPHVLLTAHLDQIGMMVSRVTDKGFLKAAPCGGLDRRSLAGARVTVHTAAGALPGVVCATPPHLSGGDRKTVKADEAVVDVGLSAERARAQVACGDRITFDGPVRALMGDRICGAALDDRAGCAAVIRAAQTLSTCETANLSVALATMEEIGSSGAETAAFALSPDFAFAVDVSMGVTPDDRPDFCGVMGAGPMVGIAPLLNRRLSAKIIETAKREKIPVQYEVMGAKTGTDADQIAPCGAGVATSVLSIPLRYMHTPAEVLSLSDVENTARLIAAVIGGGLW